MYKGQYYHIYNRGNNKEEIFYEDMNYKYFLKKFDMYLSEYVDVLAYCLMPTHFHFFVKIKEYDEKDPKKTISTAFKNFFISYSKSINIKYNRTGSLFQPKFKKKEFINEFDFRTVILYIHLNPVKAGLCKNCKDWKFSSYNAIILNKLTKVNVPETLSWFGDVKEFIKSHDEKKDDITDIAEY